VPARRRSARGIRSRPRTDLEAETRPRRNVAEALQTPRTTIAGEPSAARSSSAVPIVPVCIPTASFRLRLSR
jgi:hypothetical protein